MQFNFKLFRFLFYTVGDLKTKKSRFSSIILLTSQSHDYTLNPVKRSHYSRTHAGSMLQIPLIPPKPHKRLKLKWAHRHVSAYAWRVTQLRSPFWWLHQLPEVPPKTASIASEASNRFGEINDHEEHYSYLTEAAAATVSTHPYLFWTKWYAGVLPWLQHLCISTSCLQHKNSNFFTLKIGVANVCLTMHLV